MTCPHWLPTRASAPSVTPKTSASSGWICTKGSTTWLDNRAAFPVRVMVCQWSRTRPVLSTTGKRGSGRWAGGRGSTATNCARPEPVK